MGTAAATGACSLLRKAPGQQGWPVGLGTYSHTPWGRAATAATARMSSQPPCKVLGKNGLQTGNPRPGQGPVVTAQYHGGQRRGSTEEGERAPPPPLTTLCRSEAAVASVSCTSCPKVRLPRGETEQGVPRCLTEASSVEGQSFCSHWSAKKSSGTGPAALRGACPLPSTGVGLCLPPAD